MQEDIFNVEASCKRGALLLLQDAGELVLVQRALVFSKYMSNDYNNWHAFAANRNHANDSLLLVRGFVKTTQWESWPGQVDLRRQSYRQRCKGRLSMKATTT